MSRMTKEELDEQFEQFLKESVSDDSGDLGGSVKSSSVLDSLGKVKASHKPSTKTTSSVPWWQDEDDSEGRAERAEKTVKRRYTKVRKPQAEEAQHDEGVSRRRSPPQTVSMEAPFKPTPKPRTKALDRLSEMDKSLRANQEAPCPEEDSQSNERLMCPTNESYHNAPGEGSSDDEPKACSYSDSQSQSSGDELFGPGKTFRKSLRKSQPIQEEEEEKQQGEKGSGDEEGLEPVTFSRDSLEPEDSVTASGPGRTLAGLGLDTLEEEEEKARFFAHLEGGATSTIDYSRLNKELESTTSTTATTLRKAEPVEEGEVKRQDEEAERNSPGSHHYSEDFEDEGSANEALEEKPLRPAMLAKVSLHDSLDSTGDAPPTREEGDAEAEEEDRRREVKDTLDSLETEAALPAQSYGQSGASEMEALHEAYRQISHSAGETGDHPPRLLASLLGRDGSSGPGSPATPSPPGAGPSRGALGPDSTTESDLPTAEELLRPIRPQMDDSRGFTLQPVPGAPASPPPLSPSPVPRPRSIRDEVEKLMQEGGLTDQPRQPSRAPQHQASVRPTASGPSSLSQRKPAAPGRGRGGRGRKPPAVGPRSLGPGRHGAVAWTGPGTGAKTGSKTGTGTGTGPKTGAKSGTGSGAKPSLHLSHTYELSPSPAPTGTAEAAPEPLNADSELARSAQSFADFLRRQIKPSGCQETVSRDNGHPLDTKGDETERRELRRAEEELPLVDRLRLQLAQKDRELASREEQLLRQHQQELNSLRQENFVLQSKLRGAEEVSRKWRTGLEPSDSITEEKIRLMEKEMKEQETLIQGYHQENEKLYQMMTAQQAQSKLNEEAMFIENQTLLNELKITKEQLNKSNTPRSLGNVGLLDHSQRITELLGQLQTAQRAEAQLVEDTHRLKQEKQVVEVELQMTRRERDQARTQALHTSGDRSWELRVQEDRHREEVSALTRRLQWFAENQDLLDRDAARLKQATAETQSLTQQVERLKEEVGRKRASQLQSRAKERAADARRIQDLQRQVKELEEILRRRNPNSLPALLYAAASVGGAQEQGEAPPTQTAALLERRIHRLEAEIDSKDEEAKRSLRTLEQHFQRVKLQYEQQISDLERRVVPGLGESREVQVQSLQEELVRLKETHHNQVQDLQNQVHSLQEQLAQKAQSTERGPDPEPSPGRAQRSPSRHQRQAEAALGVRIERLTQELAAKTRSVQELSRTVDRLQKERRTILVGPGPRSELRGAEAKKQTGGAPPKAPTPGEKGETFPPTQDEKDYQPTAFSGSHISEVLQESEALRARLEQLELQRDQERLELQTAAAQAQGELRRLQESLAEQLTSLRAGHQRELERLVTRHALEHSSSKVAELTNQVSTQEIMVQHLREQVKELQSTKDALSISRLREDTLQNQLAKLLEDLKQAKEAHSPELRHFCSLEKKIHNMELRHAQRETELQQMIGQTRQVVEEEQQEEVHRWRRLAQERSRELEVFRLELDSILDVLRELQRQGVVIPYPDQPSTAAFTWTK